MKKFTVTLPAELAQAVDELAARTYQSRSDLVRQALQPYVQAHQGSSAATSLLDAVADLVGCFAGGPENFSTQSKHMAKFGQR